jgi:hypothetical protein
MAAHHGVDSSVAVKATTDTHMKLAMVRSGESLAITLLSMSRNNKQTDKSIPAVVKHLRAALVQLWETH